MAAAASVAASASSSAAAAPQAEAMPSSSPCRYKEGSRVLMVTNGREKGKQRWVKADVYRIEEGSGRTALHLREVGGHREEFKVLVPHNETTALTDTNQMATVGWDVSKKVPAGFGDDLVASLFSFMTPRELSAIFPPPRSTEAETTVLPNKRPRRRKPTPSIPKCRLPSVGGHGGTHFPPSLMASSSALPSTTGGPLFAGTAFGPLNKGETTAAANEDTADGVPPGAPAASSLFGGLSLFGLATGGGGLWSAAAAASSGGGTSSLSTFGAATPTPRPSTDVFNGLSDAPSPAATTTTTTTAPVDRFSGSIFAPAKAPSTAQSTATPFSKPFEFGKASTGGGGDLFHVGAAASGGGSLFGEVGSTGSCTGRGSLSGQGGAATGTGGIFGGSISGGTGVAASSSFSGPSLSARGSMLGGPAFGQQSSFGAAQSGLSPIHTAALHQQTHVAIDSSTEDDRQFWDSMTTEEAFQLGKRLVNLTALTLVQPHSDRWWCLGSMISVVEGHAAGRREARDKEGQHHMAEGSLETIDFTTTSTSPSTTSSPSPSITGNVNQHRPPIPPSFAPPPTLHARKAVTGAVQQHSVLVNTRWKMPALESVDQDGWDAITLGRSISSSQSLKRVEGCRRSWGRWADLFEHFSETPDGQPGPLRQLQTVGGIALSCRPTSRSQIEAYLEGVRRLQDVLTSRGCRKSLTSLDVEIPSFAGQHSLSALLAVDDFINTCCTSPDVPLSVTTGGNIFNLAVFYADAFPPRPSPFIKTAIQEAAQQTMCVAYTISQDDLTHPLDDPSQAAVEIAKTLLFDKVKWVSVDNANGFVPPPGTTSPAPAIISHLQQLPTGRILHISSGLGGGAGRLMAEKMPREVERRVERVQLGSDVGTEERSGVLRALGAEREVLTVEVGRQAISVTQGGAFDGWGSNRFPAIRNIYMELAVPDDLEDDVAVELISSGLTSLLDGGVRGLECVKVWLSGLSGDRVETIRQLLPSGVAIGDFYVTTQDGWSASHIKIRATRRP